MAPHQLFIRAASAGGPPCSKPTFQIYPRFTVDNAFRALADAAAVAIFLSLSLSPAGLPRLRKHVGHAEASPENIFELQRGSRVLSSGDFSGKGACKRKNSLLRRRSGDSVRCISLCPVLSRLLASSGGSANVDAFRDTEISVVFCLWILLALRDGVVFKFSVVLYILVLFLYVPGALRRVPLFLVMSTCRILSYKS